MKKAIATPPGKPTIYEDLTPEEITQRQADEAKHAAEIAIPAPVTLAEKVDALMAFADGDRTLLDEVKAKEAARGGG